MVDFARWGYAIAEALNQGLGEKFLAEYGENQDLQHIEVISNDPTATMIVEMLSSYKQFEGTASQLICTLRGYAQYNFIGRHNIPVGPAQMSRKLNEIQHTLETEGIIVEHSRTGIERKIKLINTKAE